MVVFTWVEELFGGSDAIFDGLVTELATVKSGHGWQYELSTSVLIEVYAHECYFFLGEYLECASAGRHAEVASGRVARKLAAGAAISRSMSTSRSNKDQQSSVENLP